MVYHVISSRFEDQPERNQKRKSHANFVRDAAFKTG